MLQLFETSSAVRRVLWFFVLIREDPRHPDLGSDKSSEWTFCACHFAGKLVAWCRVSRDVGRFLWLVFYLCSFIFTAVSARKNFELELATGGSIALINIHIRQSYVDCSHTP